MRRAIASNRAVNIVLSFIINFSFNMLNRTAKVSWDSSCSKNLLRYAY
jgi:hypothetical protein